MPLPIHHQSLPNPPDVYNSEKGWDTYATGFLIGGIGGSILAYAIVSNVDVFQNFRNLFGW
jgi:photosystem I subunit XI